MEGIIAILGRVSWNYLGFYYCCKETVFLLSNSLLIYGHFKELARDTYESILLDGKFYCDNSTIV